MKKLNLLSIIIATVVGLIALVTVVTTKQAMSLMLMNASETIDPVRVLTNKVAFLQCGITTLCTGAFAKQHDGRIVRVGDCLGCVPPRDLFIASVTNNLEVLNRFDWILLSGSDTWRMMIEQYGIRSA